MLHNRPYRKLHRINNYAHPCVSCYSRNDNICPAVRSEVIENESTPDDGSQALDHFTSLTVCTAVIPPLGGTLGLIKVSAPSAFNSDPCRSSGFTCKCSLCVSHPGTMVTYYTVQTLSDTLFSFLFCPKGLKVNRLDMYGEKYKPFKGIKYMTKAGKFQVRT